MNPAIATAASPSVDRRHDLDALRAVAMLLGVALHASMSFMPELQGSLSAEVRPHAFFSGFLACIHGFRMPLFFLLSGFFTAMLYRKRGLPALLNQRWKRIGIPFLLSLVTILPVTWAAMIASGIFAAEVSNGPADALTGELIVQIAHGDVAKATELLDRGAPADGVKWGTTPLHAAFFYGRPEIAQLLIDRGAKLDTLDAQNQKPGDLLAVDFATTQQYASRSGATLDETKLREGRAAIAAKHGLTFEMKPSSVSIVQLLIDIPIFLHLWFLWYLIWLVAGFALFVVAAPRLGLDRLPAQGALSPFTLLAFLAATIVLQYLMVQPGGGFGPDTGSGLLPKPYVLVYYALFFGFGAWYFEAHDRQALLGRHWRILLPLGLLVAFPVGLATAEALSGPPRWLTSAIQAAYTWIMCIGLMGCFHSLMPRENRTMRYLSDASYWIYLAHLAVVTAFQIVVSRWPISAFIKFPLVLVATIALLLLSYQYMVRYTWIGRMLNGPRTRAPSDPSSGSQAETESPLAPPIPSAVPEPVAIPG